MATIVRLPESKWYRCETCAGTGSVLMERDAHRSAGTIPCPNHHCYRGTITSYTKYTAAEKREQAAQTEEWAKSRRRAARMAEYREKLRINR